MKKLIAVLIFLTGGFTGYAQKKSQNVYVDSKHHLITYAVYDVLEGVIPGFTVDSSTKWVETARQTQLPNQALNAYFFLSGTKKIDLFAHILKGDIRSYRYNIVQDDSIYLATNAIPVNISRKPEDGNRLKIDFGYYNIENKKLRLEIYSLTNPTKASTITIYNKELRQAAFSAVLKVTDVKRGQIENILKDGSSFKMRDSKETVRAIGLYTQQTDVAFFYKVYVKNITTGKTLPFGNNWFYMYQIRDPKNALSEAVIDASFFEEPGEYEMSVEPQQVYTRVNPQNAGVLHFTVLKPDRVYSLQFVLWALLAIVGLGVVIFVLIHYYNKSKLAEQEKQKEMAQVQLSAVRSQLNPHFLFNALSGIQNLMNKSDVDQANRYLTKFARLTRNVLKSNDLISIADETALLDDYLQMEQLRFGFNFNIELDQTPGFANAEIPAMLLQPFVENAVKHGVADKGADGKINIGITKQGQDIDLAITDNGKGFDTGKESTGLGLALSKKRITLLNSIYKGSPVLIDIQSDNKHTTVKITLTRWL